MAALPGEEVYRSPNHELLDRVSLNIKQQERRAIASKTPRRRDQFQ